MSVIETFKSAYDIAKQISNLELQKQLIDIQAEMMALQNENFELKKANDELKQKLEQEKSMVYDKDNNVYYHNKENSDKDGPFCPRCWEEHRRQSRFHPFGLDKKCNVCEMVVGDKNQEQQTNDMDGFFNNW